MTRSTFALADLDRSVVDAPRPTGHIGIAQPVLISADGPVVALRQRSVIQPGGLADRALLRGQKHVTAYDLDGAPWWIPAEAVWTDTSRSEGPSVPRSTGLATAGSRERALLAGLSDRMGWEAMASFERSQKLSLVDTSTLGTSIRQDGVAVLDGQLGLDIPTVVVIGDDVLRWGAGATWDAAIQRALYRDAGIMEPAIELAQLTARLERHDLTVATVDLGSPALQKAGIHRLSVQLLNR